MLVEQEQRDGEDAGDREFAEGKSGEQSNQKQEHDEVESAGDPERALNTEVAGDGMKAGVAIKLEILAGVEDVEAGDPESDGGGEQKDAWIERTAYGDPCGGGSDTESESEHEVRPAREAFGVRVKKDYGQGDRGKPEGQAIQLSGGENEDGAGSDDERSDERRRKMPGGKRAGASAGVGGVNGSVGETVEGHGGGAGGNHGDDDPEKLMRGGEAGSGEHGSAECKRESEDGVLPLDHFKSDTEVVQDGHT